MKWINLIAFVFIIIIIITFDDYTNEGMIDLDNGEYEENKDIKADVKYSDGKLIFNVPTDEFQKYIKYYASKDIEVKYEFGGDTIYIFSTYPYRLSDDKKTISINKSISIYNYTSKKLISVNREPPANGEDDVIQYDVSQFKNKYDKGPNSLITITNFEPDSIKNIDDEMYGFSLEPLEGNIVVEGITNILKIVNEDLDKLKQNKDKVQTIMKTNDKKVYSSYNNLMKELITLYGGTVEEEPVLEPEEEPVLEPDKAPIIDQSKIDAINDSIRRSKQFNSIKGPFG